MNKTVVQFALFIVVCASLVACSKESKTVSGSVIRGESARHKVAAKTGQTLDVKVTSDENNAVFQIYLPGERGTLTGAGETDDATSWSGKLPADGEYTIVVGPTRGNASYKLTYSVK